MSRKFLLSQDQIYHIFSRSIAGFQIFNNNSDYQRILQLLKYFQIKEPPTKFSFFLELKQVQQNGFFNYFGLLAKDQIKIIQIIAYCLMPTHIHLILKQLTPDGISKFMGNFLNSYSRYFNSKYHRKGPLWESKFQNVLVEKDEQLLHLTRYLHLNPVTAHLIEQPEDWIYSSFNEYIGKSKYSFCRFKGLLEIDPNKYRKFVLDRIAYQRELDIIKKQIID